MSSATKIVVVKLKELVITGVLALLAVILLILFIIHITNRTKTDSDKTKEMFNPGVYTASVVLSRNTMDVEVVVDSSQVKSIRLVDNADAIETMYPLINSSLSDIETQVKQSGSTSEVTYTSDKKYTSIVLLKAIDLALDKARK